MVFNVTLRTTRQACGALGIAICSLGLVACGGSGSESKKFSQTVEANQYGIVATRLEENTGYVHVKGTQQFRLFGIDGAGKTLDLTNSTIWQISNKSLGRINSRGLFTPTGEPGELTLTAEFAGHIKSQPVTIANANLLSIAVTHSSGSVDVCRNTEFTAEALFDNGLVLAYPITWKLANSSNLASFSSAETPLLHTYRSGQVQVVAEGLNNSGAVVQSTPLAFVIADNLQTVVLTATNDNNVSSTSLREGQETNITATATYTNGATANITSNASLSMDETSAATLTTNTGRLVANTGSYAGTEVIVKGFCDDQEAQLAMRITKPNVASIQITNSSGGTASVSLTEGTSTDLAVTALFEGSTESDSDYDYNLEWSIDEAQSDNFDTEDVSINSEGKLEASGNLNLLLQLRLVVKVRIVDAANNTQLNTAGEELVDTINVIINPDNF